MVLFISRQGRRSRKQRPATTKGPPFRSPSRCFVIARAPSSSSSSAFLPLERHCTVTRDACCCTGERVMYARDRRDARVQALNESATSGLRASRMLRMLSRRRGRSREAEERTRWKRIQRLGVKNDPRGLSVSESIFGSTSNTSSSSSAIVNPDADRRRRRNRGAARACGYVCALACPARVSNRALRIFITSTKLIGGCR